MLQLLQSNQGYDPGSLGLSVKSWVGPNEVMCLCPYHDSWGVANFCFNVRKGVFICYACGARGNVYQLAKQTGGHVYRGYLPPAPPNVDIDWLKLAHHPLAFRNAYLQSRGVTDAQVEKYQIKLHPLGVVFPITNVRGQIVGALMRKHEGKLRYLTLGEKTPIWPLGEYSKTITGNNRVALVEGVFGVLAADRAGIPAFAVLGALVKESARQYLSDLRPLVVFDNDQAGYIGAGRVLKMSPLASVVVPGREADEMTVAEWKEVWEGNCITTNDISRLAKLSGDEKHFYRYQPHSRKQVHKQL